MATQTVIGVFSDREDAEHAINQLDAQGFNSKDISIVMKDKREGQQLAENTGADVAEGAVGGASTGAILGGLAGLVAAFMIPGLGAFFIGGPLATALGLTGAAASTVSGAATGALAGGLIGALTGLGVSEEDAQVYETRVKEGGILVAVPVSDGRADDVTTIMEEHHATNVNSVAHKGHSSHTSGHHHATGM